MRNRWLDTLRFAAVCAVVLQHSVWPSADAGVRPALATLGLSIWALPLLFATSGYLSTMGRRQLDLGKRMRRLLVPYVAWSVLLFAYTVQQVLRGVVQWEQIDWVGVVFAGEAFYTLWFLAMLVYATLIGWFLRTPRARLVGAAAGIAGYCGVAMAFTGQAVPSTDTVSGFLRIAPLCVAAYLAGALLPDVRFAPSRRLAALLCAAALAADAALYVQWGARLTQERQFAIMVVATGAALLGLWVLAQSPQPALLRAPSAAGQYALGIYAIHAPLLIAIWVATGTRESASLAVALGIWPVATGAAWAISVAMSRVSWLRPLVR